MPRPPAPLQTQCSAGEVELRILGVAGRNASNSGSAFNLIPFCRPHDRCHNEQGPKAPPPPPPAPQTRSSRLCHCRPVVSFPSVPVTSNGKVPSLRAKSFVSALSVEQIGGNHLAGMANRSGSVAPSAPPAYFDKSMTDAKHQGRYWTAGT